MSINKVDYYGETLIDLSSDTITEANHIVAGRVGHLANGEKVTGTYAPKLQSESVTPTEQKQTVTPQTGFDGLSQVEVQAISSNYVGSGITKQTAKTVTPTGSEQTVVASGVYTTGVVKVAAVPTETKTVSDNGTYTPTSGKFFNEVTVNIPIQKYYTGSSVPSASFGNDGDLYLKV